MAKAATKAKAKTSVASAKAKAKAASRGRSLKQRAGQKIRENLGDLADSQCYVQTCTTTGLTIEETLIKDLRLNDEQKVLTIFGKLYYQDLRSRYRRAGSLFANLSAGPEDRSEIDTRLLQAPKKQKCMQTCFKVIF